MILFTDEFKLFFNDSSLQKIADICLRVSLDAFNVNNGNIPKWTIALDELKALPKGEIELNEPYIRIDQNSADPIVLERAFKRLLPWRKGPFIFNNLKLESEWQGDFKWKRLQKHITPLKNRRVLDVGAGNGYFTLRMAMEGARKALGIEPFLLFNYQYAAIKSLVNKDINAMLLPIRLEEMPKLSIFDSVFSMGVLYHQRSHMEHLLQLKDMMAPGAELILETLVVEGPDGYSLIPDGRYAQMRNVHCLPSVETLKSWLVDTKFENIRVIDISKTSSKEQRRTEWIGDNAASLEDFLDPSDSSLTKEGYPAPTRVIIICNN
ncbi:tRNA 5-methoxyuridine(34)/uridine 5-oxyacetic acid(34) synthase CmoB [Candidatus Thioglobus sp.]|nr:tRNA 5-methoxyuridine(34)/uridine 5-oxyacetic acid(34) synthase CmoB [Candidatus Thioglobus sp.]